MKIILPFIVIITLLIMASCGGDSDTEEPTTRPEPTPTAQPSPTSAPEPLPTPEAIPSPTLEASPTPTPEPSPTPEATPETSNDAVEVVLESIMPDLVVAFANVDGEWQGYTGPKATPLDTLTKGNVYYWYANEDIALSSYILSQKWNITASPLDTAPIADALVGYEQVIPVVIEPDVQTQQNLLYLSSAVAPLTEIPEGQTYITVIVESGDPRPVWETTTR